MSRNPFIRLLHFLFFAVLVRAVMLVVLGLIVRNRSNDALDDGNGGRVGADGVDSEPQQQDRLHGIGSHLTTIPAGSY